MASPPRLTMPPGVCDCHMHIFDSRFPLAEKARRQEGDADCAPDEKTRNRILAGIAAKLYGFPQ